MTSHNIQPEDIPEWPVVRIVLHPDPTTGTPMLTIAGNRVDVPAGQDPRRYAITAAARQARMLGRPIRVIARDDANEWPLIVHPDGGITDPNAAQARQTPGPRMPAGLGLGIAGLVLLIGLAASVFVVGPTALRTIAAPPPASAPAHTAPATPPPPRTQRSAPPPTTRARARARDQHSPTPHGAELRAINHEVPTPRHHVRPTGHTSEATGSPVIPAHATSTTVDARRPHRHPHSPTASAAYPTSAEDHHHKHRDTTTKHRPGRTIHRPGADTARASDQRACPRR